MTNHYRCFVHALVCTGAFVLAGTNAALANAIVTFQAESGTLGADWAISNGVPNFITITSNLAGEAPTNAARVASYPVTFPEAGIYNLYGRMRVGTNGGASGANDDSFYYGNGFGVKSPTDAAAWIKCNSVNVGGFTGAGDVVSGSGSAGVSVWKWVSLSEYTGTSGSGETPVTFTVTAGNLNQTLQIGGREDGLDFDKFAFGTAGLPFTVADLDNGTVPTNTVIPLKIMAVGDSITDDCVVVGSWRKPLQPLLDNNGFSFTFVGRQTSTASSGFTKLSFEGYCGAVVASPGVTAAHQYTAANNYLQLIVPEALTANPNPDLMMILIGANDIGNSRNPFLVATNHIAALLTTIFATAPNTRVLLAKATREENTYTAGGPNIPIYNAALQGVVNQRRAQGQKVYLADLYSVVTYPGNFSDGLHPNAAGLQQAANEWYARLQTLIPRPNLVNTVLINGGASWKYNDNGQDLGASWTQNNYDDSGWSNGIARLGYGDTVIATTVSYGPQSANKYTTTYFRRPFVVPANAVITNLNLRVAQTDGAVVYLNGQEVYRNNMPAGQPSYASLAASTLTYYPRYIFNPTNVAVNLTAGTNWITAEVHLGSVTAAAMGFDMELIGSGNLLPPPALAISRVDDSNVTLNWPLTYGSGYSLYSTTNLDSPASWLPAAVTQTNGGQLTVTQSLDESPKFFRLQGISPAAP